MPLTRRGRRLRAVAVAVAVGLLVAYVLTRTQLGNLLGLGGGPPCTVTVIDEDLSWSYAQAETATTVAGVGTRIGASIRGVAEAVRRGLASLDAAGDEAPALGPRTAREIYRNLPDVAQPDEDSLALAGVLLGHDGAALTCVLPFEGDDRDTGQVGVIGLTPTANELRRQMRAVFGKQSLGGFAPDGVRSGHIEGSAHYEGRAIDIFFRPITEDNQRLGWQQALWAVAHAESLDIATVIFDRRIWTASRSVQGWRDYRHPSGRTDNPVLLHEDHVHLDVPG